MYVHTYEKRERRTPELTRSYRENMFFCAAAASQPLSPPLPTSLTSPPSAKLVYFLPPLSSSNRKSIFRSVGPMDKKNRLHFLEVKKNGRRIYWRSGEPPFFTGLSSRRQYGRPKVCNERGGSAVLRSPCMGWGGGLVGHDFLQYLPPLPLRSSAGFERCYSCMEWVYLPPLLPLEEEEGEKT